MAFATHPHHCVNCGHGHVGFGGFRSACPEENCGCCNYQSKEDWEKAEAKLALERQEKLRCQLLLQEELRQLRWIADRTASTDPYVRTYNRSTCRYCKAPYPEHRVPCAWVAAASMARRWQAERVQQEIAEAEKLPLMFPQGVNAHD